jgi:hypothetical protein
VLDGRVDLFQEGQVREAAEVEGSGGFREQEARLGHVDVQLLLVSLGQAVGGDVDGRLRVGRVEAQELLLRPSDTRPILEADEPRIASPTPSPRRSLK